MTIGRKASLSLTALYLSACALEDPDGEDAVYASVPAPAAMTQLEQTPTAPTIAPTRSAIAPAGETRLPSAPASASPVPPKTDVGSTRSTDRCKERMVEIQGNYCLDVMHRCIKGGKNHLGEDAPEPMPFYCERYQRGFAKCLSKEEPKHFCIDQYEYPNHEGTLPTVMVSWYEAQQLCEVQGKRLCGDDEWTLACEGPERLPYPYGWERDATACNIDHLWVRPNDELLMDKTAEPLALEAEVNRLSKRVPSGSMPACTSAYGVMDLGGNVDEWAVNVTYHGKPYQSVFKGGHWVSGARNRCRPVTTSHDETTRYYAEGFRCCSDVMTTLPP